MQASPRGRFLDLGLGDRVPDAKTGLLYPEALAQADKQEELFKLFDHPLAGQCYIARGGQILDASIVPVPRNHNTGDHRRTSMRAGMTRARKRSGASFSR